jgi:hypothetical protein
VSQRASESILVNAEPLAVYKVATDFGHYVDWAADLKKVDVLSTDDQGRALEVAFRAAAFGRSTSYTLRYDYAEAPEVLSWSQTRGDLTTVPRREPAPKSPTNSKLNCWFPFPVL